MRRFALAVCAVVGSVIASPAIAEPPECSIAGAADKLVVQANAAFAAERFQDAQSAYARAYACNHDASLLFNMSKADLKLGRYMEGLDEMRRFELANPDAPHEVRSAAEDVIHELLRHVGRVYVTSNAPAHVFIGTTDLGSTPLDGAEVAEGRVTLRVVAAGNDPFVKTVDVGGGARVDVAAAFARPSNSTGPVVPSPTRERPRIHPLVFAGVAIAGAGLAVGLGTGVASFVQTKDIEKLCPINRCPASEDDARSKAANTLANVQLERIARRRGRRCDSHRRRRRSDRRLEGSRRVARHRSGRRRHRWRLLETRTLPAGIPRFEHREILRNAYVRCEGDQCPYTRPNPSRIELRLRRRRCLLVLLLPVGLSLAACGSSASKDSSSSSASSKATTAPTAKTSATASASARTSASATVASSGAFVRERPLADEQHSGPDACAYIGGFGFNCVDALVDEKDPVKQRYMRRMSDADARQAFDALKRYGELNKAAHAEMAMLCATSGPCGATDKSGQVMDDGYSCLTAAEGARDQKEEAVSKAAHARACKCDPKRAQIPVPRWVSRV